MPAAIAALALPFVLTGCSTNKPAGVSGATGDAKNPGNILRHVMTTEPTSLDPAKVEDGTTIDLLQQVFEGLAIWGDDNKIHPNLAEKWDISPDGKTYTFHLLKGVKFTNGRELTADDFKYSIERACDKRLASPTAPVYLKDIVGVSEKVLGRRDDVPGVKAVDKYTLEITIDGFKPYWIGNMTYPCAYAVCKEEVEKNRDARGVGQINETVLTSTTGTGPFKFTEVARNSQVSLAANADYRLGKPKIDGIVRPIVKDGTQRISKYRVGDADIVPDISPRDLDNINADPQLKPALKSFARAAVWYVGLNQDAPNSPFTKREVRQAFAMAIDNTEAIKIGMRGQADRADGILPIGVPGKNEHIKPLGFDPSKAKALLAAAGYPDGKGFPTLTFSYRSDYPHTAQVAEVIASQLKTNLNINVQLRPTEWAQLLKERTEKILPLTLLRWSADYLDPQNFLSTLLHSSRRVNGVEDHPENGVGYKNPQFDALCDTADSEHDPVKRFAEYNTAEQIAIDDAPWVPIYYQRDLELVNPRVNGIKDSLFGHRPFITTTVQ